MAKYIFQLRRGTRYVDEHGATLLNEDGTPIRDDWGTYTAQDNHLNPLDGELVVEFEYNPATGKKTPRFKLGYDDNIFADLEYISPDSFILPKPASVYLDPNAWEQMTDENGEIVPDTYYQEVTVDNAIITENSKVDLQPDALQLLQLSDAGISLVAENDSGLIAVCAVGGVPVIDCGEIQVTVKEIATT